MITKILSDNLTYSQINSENPTICFLHGWGWESRNWQHISGEVERIAIDIPEDWTSETLKNSLSQQTTS